MSGPRPAAAGAAQRPAGSAGQTYSKLVILGCLCGGERSSECPLHPPGDNRSLAAWFRAGMPNGFPLAAKCAACGAVGLMYPDTVLDAPEAAGGHEHRPTLICPRCSSPAAERVLVAAAERFGYTLKPVRVFDPTGNDHE